MLILPKAAVGHQLSQPTQGVGEQDLQVHAQDTRVEHQLEGSTSLQKGFTVCILIHNLVHKMHRY